jgi:ribosomal protein S18 acetylase RimI-like enzyme
VPEFSTVTIRPATSADVPAVLPMVAKICALHEGWDAAKFGFLPEPAERYRRWLTAQAKNDRSVFLVAEPEATSSLAGFLIGTTETEVPIYRVKEYGFIHDLWVEPEYRKAGVARRMVEAAIAQFTQIGVPQVRLDVASPNEAALRLFKTCGFRVSTLEMLIELKDT